MFTVLDRVICAADDALRTLAATATASRPMPSGEAQGELSESERRHVCGLMRVDHAGEVCAQALYAGQALMARDPGVRATLARAANEERDHLAWCAQRLEELGSAPSALSPVWFAGSFLLGVASGAAGDRWSMGFLVETERQVERHLDGHLGSLPPQDQKSRAILEQMREDEISHAQAGQSMGARELPLAVQRAMGIVSRVMTATAYRI